MPLGPNSMSASSPADVGLTRPGSVVWMSYRPMSPGTGMDTWSSCNSGAVRSIRPHRSDWQQ